MIYRTAPFSIDHEQPQTQISRSGHSLMLNVSEIAKDTATVTMDGESNGTIFNDLTSHFNFQGHIILSVK